MLDIWKNIHFDRSIELIELNQGITQDINAKYSNKN